MTSALSRQPSTECKLRISITSNLKAGCVTSKLLFSIGAVFAANRCARSAIAFKLYTFLGNDCLYERSAPTLSRRAHSLSRRARPFSVGARTISVGEHSVDPLSVGAPSVCPLSVGPLSVVARASSHLVRVPCARPVCARARYHARPLSARVATHGTYSNLQGQVARPAREKF